ncbi:FTR1 family iron permease [Hollandina sp. SP2]
MRKQLALPVLVLFVWQTAGAPLFADAGYWEDKERNMRLVLSEAYYRFVAGDIDGAREQIDQAYTAHYQGDFEDAVRSTISDARADNIDEWFDYVKMELDTGKSQKELRDDFNQLNNLLSVTARRLDGHEEPAAVSVNWTKIAEEMAVCLDRAYELYLAGNAQGAKDAVDIAYFQYYEKAGFEKIVLTSISGARASTVEYQFSAAKKVITRGEPDALVKESLDLLTAYLREDAAALDSKAESALGVFLSSLLIILREGFEAIIIVGAIVAYLLKSGSKDKTRPVYIGSIIALAASVVMAWILNMITSTVAGGQSQEIIEGATMLLAVVVLFYVSNWMVSKSEAEAWTNYIAGKVQSSIDKGSMFSLAFAAFLAVFREGAETILFYQALLASTDAYTSMIWAGLGVGAVALVAVYILIRVLSIRLPLKPFFLGTSVLLFIMSITFVGNGIKELQEGNVIGVTPVAWIGSVDILGIYPTLETLIPQVVLLAVTVGTFVIQIRRTRAAAAV